MTAMLAIVILASFIGLLRACWKEYGPELRALTATKSSRRRKNPPRKKTNWRAIASSAALRILDFLLFIFHLDSEAPPWRPHAHLTPRHRTRRAKRPTPHGGEPSRRGKHPRAPSAHAGHPKNNRS